MNSLVAATEMLQKMGWTTPSAIVWLHSQPLVRKVFTLSLQHFVLLQNYYVLGFGMKSLVFDSTKHHEAATQVPATPRTKQHHEKSHKFYLVHGVLFATSGIAGIVAILSRSFFLKMISQSIFACANLVSLKYYAETFLNARDEGKRVSAALGFASNLGYILSTASLVLRAHALVALLFGCLALVCGGTKVIYDALFLASQKSEFGIRNSEASSKTHAQTQSS